MRFFSAICATLLFCGFAFGQVQVRPVPGPYVYAPYVPLITTPEVSLNTVSPAPVGASNATYGLTAGARNSTLSMLNENTSSSYTEPVWYSGGSAPLVSPEISLSPRPVHGQRMMRMEERRPEREERAAAPKAWTYFGASEMEAPVDVNAAKNAKHATRTITNDDIDRANQNTGTVKYDSKTEKIQ